MVGAGIGASGHGYCAAIERRPASIAASRKDSVAAPALRIKGKVSELLDVAALSGARRRNVVVGSQMHIGYELLEPALQACTTELGITSAPRRRWYSSSSATSDRELSTQCNDQHV